MTTRPPRTTAPRSAAALCGLLCLPVPGAALTVETLSSALALCSTPMQGPTSALEQASARGFTLADDTARVQFYIMRDEARYIDADPNVLWGLAQHATGQPIDELKAMEPARLVGLIEEHMNRQAWTADQFPLSHTPVSLTLVHPDSPAAAMKITFRSKKRSAWAQHCDMLSTDSTAARAVLVPATETALTDAQNRTLKLTLPAVSGNPTDATTKVTAKWGNPALVAQRYDLTITTELRIHTMLSIAPPSEFEKEASQ